MGVPVGFTATANYDLGLTDYALYIVADDGFGWVCTSGKSCDIEESRNTPGSTIYHAFVAKDFSGTATQITSSSVTVTWNPVPGATYHALAPTRLLDSRNGTGLSGAFSSHVARQFQVTGGSNGVPTNATAVTGNLTVTQQTSAGFLYMGPTRADDPFSSTLNFPLGDDRANAVTVALGSGGVLWVTYAAPKHGPTAQVVFDVTGYFTPDMTGDTFHALAPTRILDSRVGTGLWGAFRSHVAEQFQVTGGTSGVPANATAVTGNLTVTQQTSLGFLYIGPSLANNPTSSTLNFPMADDRANAVTVALGMGGILAVTFAAPSSAPTAHVIFDVTGYFTPDTTGAVFVPVNPTRLVDSRYNYGLAGAAGSHQSRPFALSSVHGGVPTSAIGVTGNITVTQQSTVGFLYLGPAQADNPTSSTLNFPAGDDRANAVDVAVGSGNALWVTYAAPSLGPTAHVIFDVTGYFAPYSVSAAGLFVTGLAGTENPGVPDNGMTVTARDAQGAVAPGYLGLVYFASSDPLATLPMEYQFTAADAGVHHFTAPDAVAFGTPGTHSVAAVDALSPSVTMGVQSGIVVGGTLSTATYHSVTTVRLLDTRDGTGGLLGPLSANVTQSFQVRGTGAIPAGAVAVTGNLTVTQQTQTGYLHIGPVVIGSPAISSLKFPLSDDRSNAVATSLSATGTLYVTYVASSGSHAHVIFDVTGYFTADSMGATFHSLASTRVLDSAVGLGLSGTFSSHVARTFTVTGIPTAAVAVTGRLTVTQQTSNGFLYVGPIGADNPSSSNLNFLLGTPRGNSVAVALGTSETLSVTYAAPTIGKTAHIVFDVTGYFAP